MRPHLTTGQAAQRRLPAPNREQTIIELWRAGHDTLTIARHLGTGTTEADVCRVLHAAREAKREGK